MECNSFKAKSKWGSFVFTEDQCLQVSGDKKGTAEELPDDAHRYFPSVTLACLLPPLRKVPTDYICAYSLRTLSYMADQTCHYYIWWSQLMSLQAMEKLQAAEELKSPTPKPAPKLKKAPAKGKGAAKGGSKKGSQAK
jgi:hypothetical protein